MKLAAIESSSLVASVAILEDDVLMAEYTTCYQKTHSQTLLPMLEQIIAMTDTDLSSLDAIAISKGPGSFTGLRIGSATAKGLGLALDIPLVEVPTLDAMAYQLYGCQDLICPMMDARRGQVYTGVYTFTEDMEFQCVLPSRAVAAQEILAELTGLGKRVIFLGDGVPVYRQLIEETFSLPFGFAPAFCARQRAGALAQLGALYFRRGESISSDLHKPEYLRLSQAERERMEQEKTALQLVIMEKTDCEEAAAIEQDLFSKPWSRQALEESLDRSESCYVAARLDGHLAGYCGLYLTGEEGYINQVAVKREEQGKGIGKKMLAFLLEQAGKRGMKACTLEVRVSNERARRLYGSLGFEESGVRPRFYEDPTEDAMILWKK